jgi:predicted AAA+ superfamily ATPase
MEIIRTIELKTIKERLESNPAAAILGPRQCGKTTLAMQFSRQAFYSEVHRFDCENPIDLNRLENPILALKPLKGLIIIDEIQRRPEIFPVLRVIIDGDPSKRFLILGSASRDLIAQSSETLAGRISFLELGGFKIQEIDAGRMTDLWIRGGFPKAFLAKNELQAAQWREDFIRTFLERDIPNLGFQTAPLILRRFWTMLSHYHGQIFNALEIGRSLNLSDKTVKRYLDIMTAAFVIRQLQPWYYNTKKRLVKRPKIYFRDSGLFHSFISVENELQLTGHPRLGASWEGFAIEQVIKQFDLKEDAVYFWGLHSGAELDLLFQKKGRLWGLEVKYQDAPKITPSMRSAINELNLTHLWVIHPGDEMYMLDEKITAIGLQKVSGLKLP